MTSSSIHCYVKQTIKESFLRRHAAKSEFAISYVSKRHAREGTYQLLGEQVKDVAPRSDARENRHGKRGNVDVAEEGKLNGSRKEGEEPARICDVGRRHKTR
jgi:hypothetical protein